MHMLRPRCSLGMLHRTCDIVHGGVGFGRLRMPIGYTFYVPINFKPWGI